MPVWRAGDGQGMGSRAAAARLLQCADGTEDRPIQRALEQRDHSVLATQRTGHADLRLHAHSLTGTHGYSWVLTDVAAGQGLRLLQATPGCMARWRGRARDSSARTAPLSKLRGREVPTSSELSCSSAFDTSSACALCD